MQLLKRSLLIALLLRAITGVGQPAEPKRDTNSITALLHMADTMVYTDPATAMRYADEALNIADTLHWTRGIALAERQKGNVYYVFSDNTTAMDWYVKALQTSRTLQNRELDASLFNNLANIYSDLKEYDKALEYYHQFLATARQLGSAKEQVIALVNMATVYTELDKQDTAQICNREALDIARHNNIGYFIPIVLNNMGIAFARQGNTDSALACFRQCITLADQAGNNDAKASALSETGKVFLSRGDYPNAKRYSLESLEMARRLQSAEWQANAWENLYQIEEKTGRYDKALNAYKQFIVFRDSVSNAEKKDALTKKELQFDFQRREAAMRAEQEKKEALAKAEIARQSLIKKGILAGALVLILVGCYGFVLYKRRRDAEETRREAEEKRKEADLRARVADTENKVLRLQLNPHFIFNSLNSISDYISQHQPEKANFYLIKFAKMIRQVLESSELAEIPIADDLKILETYIQLEAQRLANQLCYEISVEEGIDPETTLVPPLIIQPFVENSIWHGLSSPEKAADKGRISILIRQADGMISYIVEDNGIGRERAGRKATAGRRSMGLRITKERIDILNRVKQSQASVEIFDLPKGTRVEVRLPLELKF